MIERWKTAIMIRAATAGDEPRCAEIFLSTRRAAFHWQPAAPFDLDDYRRSVEDEEVWVAELGNLVVGFELKDSAADQFYTFTSSNIGQYMSVVVDKTVINTASISAEYLEGT